MNLSVIEQSNKSTNRFFKAIQADVENIDNDKIIDTNDNNSIDKTTALSGTIQRTVIALENA